MATFGEYAGIGLGGFLTWKGNTYCFQDAEFTGVELEEIESTNSCSDAKEYIGGITDFGMLDMTINFDPDLPQFTDAEADTGVFTFPLKPGQANGATFTAEMFVKSASVAVPIDDIMTQDLSFRLTGPLTHLAGS